MASGSARCECWTDRPDPDARVAAAEAALAERQIVTVIDILLGVGWLAASGEQAWRKGRIP
jgi:hypothetical protein